MIDKLKSASPLMAARPPQSHKAVETSPTQPNDGMHWSTPDFKLAAPPKFDDLKDADKPPVEARGLAEWGKKVGLGAALTVTGVVGLAGAANAQTAQVQVQSSAAPAQPMTLAQARETFLSTAPKYQGMPGLIRKYYVVSEDGRRAGGVYLWASHEVVAGA